MIRKTAMFTGLVLLGVLGALPVLRAQDPHRSRCGEIHEAIAGKGIPITSIRCSDGQYEVVPGPNCSAGQLAEAQQIMNEILSAKPVVIVVDTVQDALVVLQFEPMNESARKVLRQRYDELKAEAKKAQ